MRKAALVIVIVFLAGCSGATTPATSMTTSIVPSTSGTPAPHIYLSQTCASPTSAPGVLEPIPSACPQMPLAIFTAPLSSSSVPQPGPSPGGYITDVGFDSAGQLLAVQNQFVVYSLPLAASSTPAFAVSLGTQIGAVALDPSGNLYIADLGKFGIDVVPPPLTPSSTIAGTIALGSGVVPTAVAIAGTRLFVVTTPPTGLSAISQIMVFDPPYASASAAFGLSVQALSATTDSLGDLYLAATYAQSVLIYAPPFTAASTPFITISIPPPYAPEGLAFDGAGNLLVSTDAGPGKGAILVYTPPLSKASAPSMIVFLGAGASGRGLAAGP